VSAGIDQKHHCSTDAVAADLAVSVNDAVEQIAAVEIAAEVVAAGEDVAEVAAVEVKTGNSSFQTGQVIQALYAQLEVRHANSTDYLQEKS
jgi:hypothetical protein